MKLKLIVPEKIVVEKDVISVTMPGKLGELTVMNGHDILVTEINSGRLYYRFVGDDKKPAREDYQIGSGIAEVTKDAVKILASKAERV